MLKKLRVVKLYVLCKKESGTWNPVVDENNMIIGSIDETHMSKVLREHMGVRRNSDLKLRVAQLLIQEPQRLEDMIARDIARQEARERQEKASAR